MSKKCAEDPRELDQISPPELQGCMALLVNETMSMQTDELFSRVARVFGYRALKDGNRQMLANQLQALVADGLVVIADDSVTNVQKDAWKTASIGLKSFPSDKVARNGSCKDCGNAIQKPGRHVHNGEYFHIRRVLSYSLIRI